jgi:hypothetical protein
MSETVKDRIIEQVDRLDDPRRRLVLDFATRLASPAGSPGSDLLRFAGSIDSADLAAMSQAILLGCEKVDPNAW